MSRDILLSQITPDPSNARQYFDPTALQELADSIRASGLASPILLRPVGDGYLIVHGERRFRAVGMLGWATIPAEVRDLDEDAASWLALVENVQRADLSPIEEAMAYKRRLDKGLTQTELGKAIGKTQSYIAHKLRLFTLPDPIQFLLAQGELKEGHGRELLRFRNIFPAGFTIEFSEIVKSWADGSIWLTEDTTLDAAVMFNYLRPFAYPSVLNAPKTDRRLFLLRTILTNWGKYVVDCQLKPPSWSMTATYIATLAAFEQISIADLSKAIDSIENKLYSAMDYHFIKGGCNQDSDRLFHAAQADLRQAGINLDALDTLDFEFKYEKVIFPLIKKGSKSLPSAFQEGGPLVEEGKLIVQRSKEGEAIEREAIEEFRHLIDGIKNNV